MYYSRKDFCVLVGADRACQKTDKCAVFTENAVMPCTDRRYEIFEDRSHCRINNFKCRYTALGTHFASCFFKPVVNRMILVHSFCYPAHVLKKPECISTIAFFCDDWLRSGGRCGTPRFHGLGCGSGCRLSLCERCNFFSHCLQTSSGG